LGGRVRWSSGGNSPFASTCDSCGHSRVADTQRSHAKTRRREGGRIGRPSCEGGFRVGDGRHGGEAQQCGSRTGPGSKGLSIHKGTEPTADAVDYPLSALRAWGHGLGKGSMGWVRGVGGLHAQVVATTAMRLVRPSGSNPGLSSFLGQPWAWGSQRRWRWWGKRPVAWGIRPAPW
jgi:hypothetical protein